MKPTRRRNDGPRRILFVATDLSTGGGVNKVIRELALLFRRRFSADVTVVNARSDRPSSYDFPRDIHVQSHRRQSLVSYFLLLCRLRRTRPELVISSWTQDNILVTLAFLFSRSRLVLVEHSPWHFHRRGVRLLRRLVYPLASEVVALNRNDLDHYRRFFKNVRLIPNPVDPPVTGLAQERDKLVIAVGHLTPLKNFADAIAAFAQSGLESSGWSLAVIGSGSEEERLQALIRKLRLKRARIHSQHEDLASWYATASLLLVTSRLESFSLVLAEAMLSGVLPIAYASDGPSFILEEFPELLVRMGNVEEMAERLQHLADKPELEVLRGKLSTSVKERFAADVVADQWKALLE